MDRFTVLDTMPATLKTLVHIGHHLGEAGVTKEVTKVTDIACKK